MTKQELISHLFAMKYELSMQVENEYVGHIRFSANHSYTIDGKEVIGLCGIAGRMFGFYRSNIIYIRLKEYFEISTGKLLSFQTFWFYGSSWESLRLQRIGLLTECINTLVSDILIGESINFYIDKGK